MSERLTHEIREEIETKMAEKGTDITVPGEEEARKLVSRKERNAKSAPSSKPCLISPYQTLSYLANRLTTPDRTAPDQTILINNR